MYASEFDETLFFIGDFDDGRYLTAKLIRDFAKLCPVTTVCATTSSEQPKLNRLLRAAGFKRLSRGPRCDNYGYCYLWRLQQRKGGGFTHDEDDCLLHNTFCCGLDDVDDSLHTITHLNQDVDGDLLPTAKRRRIKINRTWTAIGERIPRAKVKKKSVKSRVRASNYRSEHRQQSSEPV